MPLPYVLGGALCMFLLYGFWRGLSLRPHEREHRPLILVGERLKARPSHGQGFLDRTRNVLGSVACRSRKQNPAEAVGRGGVQNLGTGAERVKAEATLQP
jgi:hypothetical protein